MPSGAGIAFTLLSLTFAWLLWQGRGSDWGGDVEPKWRLRLRSIIPPALLAALIPSGCASERFDSLRLYANGMTVTERAVQGGRPQVVQAPGCEAYFRPGDHPVFIIGRARACVDLVVQDPAGAALDGAVVRLDHPPGGEPMLRLSTIAGEGGLLVAARDEDGGRTFTGAASIADGDQLCLRKCGEGDAEWWTFRSGGRLERGDTVREMALRPGPYGWVRPYGPADRIHRLSQLLCPQSGADGACEQPALVDGGKPALSFLFQRGGVGGSGWQAMLVDPGARIRRADGTIVQPDLTEEIALPEGESLHLAVLGVRGNALREVRSFGVGHVLDTGTSPERRFTLALDTPEMVPIGHCARPLSRLALGSDRLSPEAFSLSSFGSRPNSVLASAAAGLPIEQFDLCRTTRFAFSAPLDPQAGDTLGGPVLRQIDFSVDRMGIPWLLLLIAGSVALLVHAASETLWQRRPLDGILLALLQYLLVVRAVIGIEGVFNDSALDWRHIYGDAGMAMIALPAILIAARRRDETSLATLASFALFLALAMAALWWWLGPPDFIGRFLATLALGALALRGLTLITAPPPRGEGLGCGPAASAVEGASSSSSAEGNHAAADAAEPPTNLPHEGEGLGRLRRILADLLQSPPNFWPILLAILVGGRILLGLLGYRERLFGVALSAIYVPLLLICTAAILAQAEKNPEQRRRLGFYFLGALALGAGLVSLVINDVGFALVHLPPIAGIALWRLRKWSGEAGSTERRTTRLLWAAPAAGLAALYLALWAFVAATPPPGEDAPLEERVAYSVDSRSTDPNWLRLRAVFAPAQIPAIGNRAAAVQLDQSVMLGELTGTMLGKGWLAPVDLGSFRFQATHLSDYLSAAHLMAPFGRLGAIALLLVLAAAAGAAVARRVRPPADWPNLAGALAIWTLFGAATYMVLANLLLVPFTGRNIYLLASSSGGDLMEGLGLLLMARIGLAHGRND